MNYDLTRISNNLLVLTLLLSILMLIIYVEFFDDYVSRYVYEINSNLLGEKVKVCGFVKKPAYKSNKYSFFFLTDGLNHSVKVVFFNYLNLNSRDYVCVRGIVKIYKGEVEIIGESIIY